MAPEILRSIKNKLDLLTSIELWNYIYLNYLTKKVIRMGKGKVIPFKGTRIQLDQDSRLILNDESIELCCQKLRNSKSESIIHLHQNSVWEAKSGCSINYGTCIEVLPNARLITGLFTINCNSTIIANLEVNIGNDVMISRNVIIYDSDFHPIYDSHNFEKNMSSPVNIGDHTWIGAGSMILKGVTIGSNCMIGANSTLTENIPNNTQMISKEIKQIMADYSTWKRTF